MMMMMVVLMDLKILFLVQLWTFTSGDPVFDTSPITIFATRTGQTSLPCLVTDLGSNIVMWRGPGRKPISIGDRMTSSDRRFSVLPRPYKEEWNLKINGVKLSDAGLYECIINTRPMQIKNITLVIPEPPIITADSSSTRENATEGSRIILECYAEGTPVPTIHWYRAVPDENGRDESLVDLNTEGYELTLESVSKESAGTYVCEASNGIQPNAKMRITLVVVYQPITTITKSSIGQFLGRPVSLECYAEGVPLPSIIWTRSGRRLTNTYKYAIHVYQENDITSISTLAIQSLDLDDFGKYACESFNSQGQSTQLATIYAAGVPTIARSQSTGDTRISEGNNLTLICFARGIPKPTVTWYKVSNDSLSMEFEEIGSGPEVIIKDVTKENSGDYKCIASSVLGNASLQIHIQVDELVKTTSTTTTQATAKPIKDKDTTTSKQHSTNPTEESGAASSTGVHNGTPSIAISRGSLLLISVIYLVYVART